LSKRAFIQFSSKGVSFQFRNKKTAAAWLQKVARKHNSSIATLAYVFVSDEALLQLNKQFLKHNTFTDIITFDYREADRPEKILGEIYISVDRVKENAETFQVSFHQELRRVMAHGLLHLCGFRDKTKNEQAEMRLAEENALALH
jgi:probable rRNA maturation factor